MKGERIIRYMRVSTRSQDFGDQMKAIDKILDRGFYAHVEKWSERPKFEYQDICRKDVHPDKRKSMKLLKNYLERAYGDNVHYIIIVRDMFRIGNTAICLDFCKMVKELGHDLLAIYDKPKSTESGRYFRGNWSLSEAEKYIIDLKIDEEDIRRTKVVKEGKERKKVEQGLTRVHARPVAPFGLYWYQPWKCYMENVGRSSHSNLNTVALIFKHYGQYYKSALYWTFNVFNRILTRWAMRKYKKLKGHRRRAAHWLGRVACHQPQLFAHWTVGFRPSAGQ